MTIETAYPAVNFSITDNVIAFQFPAAIPPITNLSIKNAPKKPDAFEGITALNYFHPPPKSL